MQRFSIFIILIFIISVSAGSDVPGPGFEEVLSLRSIGSPAISPDGKSIAFSVRTVDWKENRYDGEIWLVRDGEKPFQLTRTKDGSSGSPQRSPDGTWIAFLADRGDKRQVYLIRPNGGEAQRITDVKEGINSFEWFPDSQKILFSKTEEESKTKKDLEKRYGKFAVEDAEYRFSHLWIVDVQSDSWPSPEEVPCYESGESSGSEKNETEKSEKTCPSFPKLRCWRHVGCYVGC